MSEENEKFSTVLALNAAPKVVATTLAEALIHVGLDEEKFLNVIADPATRTVTITAPREVS